MEHLYTIPVVLSSLFLVAAWQHVKDALEHRNKATNCLKESTKCLDEAKYYWDKTNKKIKEVNELAIKVKGELNAENNN